MIFRKALALGALLGVAKILDQGVDGVLGVLLVGPDHPGRPALDPPDDVFVGAAVDSAADVGDGPALVVERQPGRGHPAVADRPHDQLSWQLLALAGVLGRHSPAAVGDQLVAAQHDPLHFALALDLDRRGQEPEHHAAVSRAGFAVRIATQHLDVLLADLAHRGRVLVGNAVQLRRIDHHVNPVEVGQLAQLQRGERGLQRTSAPYDHHLLDTAWA
ncbi:Uncharacterised protein [Mycobacterium tuberculosis]|nr:Uncharacterised protein [Mycobacterium tuberculosis]COV95908.1 Uncharacterised protein [Mycobacterium tuberculosis]